MISDASSSTSYIPPVVPQQPSHRTIVEKTMESAIPLFIAMSAAPCLIIGYLMLDSNIVPMPDDKTKEKIIIGTVLTAVGSAITIFTYCCIGAYCIQQYSKRQPPAAANSMLTEPVQNTPRRREEGVLELEN